MAIPESKLLNNYQFQPLYDNQSLNTKPLNNEKLQNHTVISGVQHNNYNYVVPTTNSGYYSSNTARNNNYR